MLVQMTRDANAFESHLHAPEAVPAQEQLNQCIQLGWLAQAYAKSGQSALAQEVFAEGLRQRKIAANCGGRPSDIGCEAADLV